MNQEFCNIPVSAHIAIDANGTIAHEFTYRTIPTKVLAGLFVRGFGIDVDERFDSKSHVSQK